VNVTCAVILAAGFGTRMLPATKAVPKELMPLVDAPVIEYIVEEAVQSGIEHIVMVTSAGKRAVEDHFGRVHDLEQLLANRGDSARLALLHSESCWCPYRDHASTSDQSFRSSGDLQDC